MSIKILKHSIIFKIVVCTSSSYWTSRRALEEAKSWITDSACFKMSSLETVRFRRSSRGVTLSCESVALLNSGLESNRRCRALSLSNDIAWNRSCLVSNGNRNGHVEAICWSQQGKLPVIITSGSCNCLFALAVILLLMNSWKKPRQNFAVMTEHRRINNYNNYKEDQHC